MLFFAQHDLAVPVQHEYDLLLHNIKAQPEHHKALIDSFIESFRSSFRDLLQSHDSDEIFLWKGFIVFR